MSNSLIISSFARCELCQNCLQSNKGRMRQVESDEPRGTIYQFKEMKIESNLKFGWPFWELSKPYRNILPIYIHEKAAFLLRQSTAELRHIQKP